MQTNDCLELVQILQPQRSDGLMFERIFENAVQLTFEIVIA